jgi:hypothetical protein
LSKIAFGAESVETIMEFAALCLHTVEAICIKVMGEYCVALYIIILGYRHTVTICYN